MASPALETQEWYLDVEGRRIGPLPGQQIADLFKEGEVLAHHRVSSPDGSRQMSVEELARELAAAPASEPRRSDDPEIHLFDTLQAARERKQAAQLDTGTHHFDYETRRKGPQSWWIAAGLGLICVLAVWGLVSVLGSGGGSALTGTAGSSSGTADSGRVSTIKTDTPSASQTSAPQGRNAAPPAPAAPAAAPARIERTLTAPDTRDHPSQEIERSDRDRGHEDHAETPEERDQRESEEQANAPDVPPPPPQDPAAPESGLVPGEPQTETVVD